MNLVVCKHPNDNGRYIFQLPADVSIDAGTYVNCETTRGIQPALCITGNFQADPEVICKLWGTEPGRMKRIISFLHESFIEWPSEPAATKNYFDE